MSESTDHFGDGECEQAAYAVVDSRVSGRRLGELPAPLRPRTVEDAYRVQRRTHDLLTDAGYGRLRGWKIGCTTLVMQEYLGVDGPVAGAMFENFMRRTEGRFHPIPGRILGVECEIAVKMGRTLDRGDHSYSPAEVARAVRASMAAIEVVEDRYVDYTSLDLPTQVADDFFHFASVVGEEHDDVEPEALAGVSSTMAINGELVGSGRGSDILGDPLVALAWLANTLVQQGSPLRADDVVSLGSLVKTQWVQPGDVVVVDNDALGGVRVVIE